MEPELDIETQLRSDIARAGGLLDMRAAAAALGVSDVALYKRWARAHERSYQPGRPGTLASPLPEPVAFRAPKSPLWTGAQIARVKRLDAKLRDGYRSARQAPATTAS
jgi:hypothetical protein